MPIFFIISGYLTRYSTKITNIKLLCSFIGRRTFSYLLPWLIWTTIVRGLLLKETIYLDLLYILSHMAVGYWFLATIWTISMIFGISDYLSNKLTGNKLVNAAFHVFFSLLGLAFLLIIGCSYDMGFFAIKFTIYYLPMFLIGYSYGQLQNWLYGLKKASKLIDVIIAISFTLWLLSISNFNFFISPDDTIFSVFRFFVSILGCITVIGLFTSKKELPFKQIRTFLNWVGKHSLEVYLTHYLFLGLAPSLDKQTLLSMDGVITLTLNYTLTLFLTILTIRIINCNSILNKVLFYKRSE